MDEHLLREITDCRACPRLVEHLARVRCDHPDYHAGPVLPFGDPEARLFIVGLAPGMHGANATGRPFTRDHAGILLYATLHAHGFSNQAQATSPDDGLELYDCRISNGVKCLPPANKPLLSEIKTCNRYLQQEIQSLPADALILSLGRIAHDAVLRALKLTQAHYPFGHAREYHPPNGLRLMASYHCSRYNTQTGRLTSAMFARVFARIREILGETKMNSPCDGRHQQENQV